jgi:hypothetical protein
MKGTIIAGTAAVVLVFGLTSAVLAFECPARFKDAKAAIAKATAAMKQMSPGANQKLVHALIDDAKMILQGGIHNHEKPQGAYDHGRSVAKAKAAEGYAYGAEVMTRALK